LGLPAGIIRTAVSSSSFTDRHSKKLFGHSSSSNPAQQARLKRERAAQRAEAKVKNMLAQRGASAPPSGGSAGTDAAPTGAGGFLRKFVKG